MSNRISEETIERIVELHHKHFYVKEIARRAGVSHITVKKRLKKLGLTPIKYERKFPKQEVLKAYNETDCDLNMAKYLGVCGHTAKKLRKKYGLKSKLDYSAKAKKSYQVQLQKYGQTLGDNAAASRAFAAYQAGYPGADSKQQADILNLLDYKGPHSAKEIAVELNRKLDTVRRLITSLVKKRMILRIRDKQTKYKYVYNENFKI